MRFTADSALGGKITYLKRKRVTFSLRIGHWIRGLYTIWLFHAWSPKLHTNVGNNSTYRVG